MVATVSSYAMVLTFVVSRACRYGTEGCVGDWCTSSDSGVLIAVLADCVLSFGRADGTRSDPQIGSVIGRDRN